MNIDTMDMWGEANHHLYHDWHPLVIPVLWSQLRHVYHGPQSMLVFEDMLFCLGALLILRRCGTRWKTVLVVTLVTIFPPVFAYLGTIGKDSLFAVSMVFTVGIYYLYSETRSPSIFCICLAASFLAFSTRQNGVFAVAPILGLLFWEALRGSRNALRRSVGLVVLSIAMFSALGLLIKTTVHARTTFPYQVIPLYDLAELSVNTHTMLIPTAFISPAGSLANIAQSTNTRFINTLIWPWGPTNPLMLSYNGDDVHGLVRLWLRTVIRHPLLYVRWRWRVISALAGFDKTVTTAYDAGGVVPNVWGVRFHRSWPALAELSFLKQIKNSLFFRAYVYLVLITTVLLRGLTKRRPDLVVVAGSALTYFLAYFFISINSEFRFACYPVFMAVILVARCFAESTQSIATEEREAINAMQELPAMHDCSGSWQVDKLDAANSVTSRHRSDALSAPYELEQ